MNIKFFFVTINISSNPRAGSYLESKGKGNFKVKSCQRNFQRVGWVRDLEFDKRPPVREL